MPWVGPALHAASKQEDSNRKKGTHCLIQCDGDIHQRKTVQAHVDAEQDCNDTNLEIILPADLWCLSAALFMPAMASHPLQTRVQYRKGLYLLYREHRPRQRKVATILVEEPLRVDIHRHVEDHKKQGTLHSCPQCPIADWARHLSLPWPIRWRAIR